MSENKTQDPQEKKMVDGGWALLLFGVLFLIIILLGWLTL
jgi:hypothetical protein